MNKQEILKNPWMDFASYGIKDASRFKGREEEIKKFQRIIDSGTVSVLYANSGIGKTSFLNAGISPIYQRMGYSPIHIVFPDEIFTFKDMEPWLLQRISVSVKQEGFTWESIIENEIEDCKNSLWWHLHTKVMKNHNTGETFYPLLIFDQFEEIFTKSRKYANEEIVENFFKLVGSLASTSLPGKIEEELDRQDTNGNYLEIDSEHHYKVIFSLRKDYLSDFDYWTNDVNSISELYQNRMFLLPLKRNQALKVITEQPIEGSVNEYYSTLNNVTDKILDLIDPSKKDEIEPYILSALCSKLYNKAVFENKQQLAPSDVDANINNIILEIYEEKVQSIFDNPDHLRRFEKALVDADGHRNRPKIKELDNIQFKDIYQQKLEDAHLIRIDPYDEDAYIELIHDLLAKAINQKREKEAQTKIIVDLENSKKKQKKQFFNWIVVLAVVFLGIVVFLILQLIGNGRDADTRYICFKINALEDTGKVDDFAPDDYWDIKLLFSTIDGKELQLKHPIDPSQCNFHKGSGIDSIILVFTETEIMSLGEIVVEIQPQTMLCRKDSFRVDLRKNHDKPVIVNILKNSEETDLFEGVVLTDFGNDTVPLNDVLIVVAGRVTYTDTAGHFLISIPRGNTLFNRVAVIKQGYNVQDVVLKKNMTIYLERNSTDNFKERQSEIKQLWRMAEKKKRKINRTERWEKKLLDKYNIDDMGKMRRGLGSNSSTDSLFYIYYNANLDSMNAESEQTNNKNGDMRNIIGTYQGSGEEYIFEGFMTLEDINTDQWKLEIVKYDTIFNTRKKNATLIHSVIPRQTKITFE